MTSKRDLTRGVLGTAFLQDNQLIAALRDDSRIDLFDVENDLVHKKLFDLDDFVVKIHGADSHLIAVKKNSVEIVDVTNSLKTLSTYKPSEHFEVFESSQFDTESNVLVVSNDENNAKKKRVEFVDWRTANASILLIDQNTPIGDHVVFTEKPKQFAVTTPGGAVNLYDIHTAKNGQPIYQVQNTGKLRRITFVNNRMCCITPGDAFKIYTKNECFEFQEEEYRQEYTNSKPAKSKKGEVAAAVQRHIVKELNEPEVGVIGNKFNLNNFQIGKMLGRRTFGYVQLVESVRTGKKFAMKVLPNTLAELADRHVVEREILIQAGMQHTNIVSFITSFATTAPIHIVMELMSHSLRQKMISDVKMMQVGSCMTLPTESPSVTFMGGLTACGTEQYKAPEMWAHEEQTPGVDMWSLGCIIFEALTKRLTFPQAKTSDMNAAIESAKVSYPHHLSNILKDLIQKLIVRKAGSRLTTSQVLDHTWIKKYQIEKNRGYARELLNEI
ncbi:hypothetical protein CRE_13772 [Caenorhabditis remanei]|uniref:Protein kinase domain-containing protein n=1 Tax=Caenorhabditis remanei TaxID=31234 RepID=E3NJN0_CAERE|nr:hypothetical protein CRE_13772 [Caenorhabditis remanei]